MHEKKGASETESVGVTFIGQGEKQTLLLPLRSEATCSNVEFLSSQEQDKLLPNKTAFRPQYILVEITSPESEARARLNLPTVSLEAPRTNLEQGKFGAPLSSIHATVEQGDLAVGTHRFALSEKDYLIVAGSDLRITEDDSVWVRGSAGYILINGKMVLPTLWSNLEVEFRVALMAAFFSVIAYYHRPLIKRAMKVLH